MSKEGLEKINNEFKEYLLKNNVSTALIYAPISDDYWNTKYKVVFCNEEPYNINYGWNGIKTFSKDILYEGLDKKSDNKANLKNLLFTYRIAEKQRF